MTELQITGLSERVIGEMRKYRMAEILSGKFNSEYSPRIMAGASNEPFFISVAIAFFATAHPAPGQESFVPQVLEGTLGHDLLPYYWMRMRELTSSHCVSDNDNSDFARIASYEDEAFARAVPRLAIKFLPTAIMVFGRPTSEIKNASEESAYLFCPTAIPPSAVYRHVTERTDAVISRFSTLS